METVLYYLLKVSVSLSVVFLFYHLVLRKLTFYQWNRWFLLGYTALSFAIPFLNIESVLEQNEWSANEIVSWVPVMQLKTVSPSMDETHSFSLLNITGWVLLSGMIIMFCRLLLQVFSFRRMIRKASSVSGEGMRLFEVKEPIIPFSFGNAIFINRQLHTAEELQEIIRHEFVHIRQRHSIDILWTEWICLVNWFNPFAWLLKKAIRQNLEFIADRQVLEHGISKKEYQYLLLKVTGNNQYSIAAPFNFSSLKKRIAMMNKLQSARVHLVRFLFILPLLAVLLLAFRGKWQGNSNPPADNPFLPKDTTRPVPGSGVNKKGYQLSITDSKGNCTVVVKDRQKNVVEKILLTDWNSRADYYEKLYGMLPPPPPPPPPGKPAPVEMQGIQLKEVRVETAAPPPPVPAVPVKLPGHVKSINIQNEKAVVQLKNGQTETYQLDQPGQLKVFEQKYGTMPAPPPPPKEVKGQPLIEERKLETPAPSTTITLMGIPVSEEKKFSEVLILIDGKKAAQQEMDALSPEQIQMVNVLKGGQAIAKYGTEAKDGAIEIFTKANAVREVIVTGKPADKKEVIVTGHPISKEKQVQ